MKDKTKILSVGTAAPEQFFSQQEMIEKLSIHDKKIEQLFITTRIKKRHLFISDQPSLQDEPQAMLLKRHAEGALHIGRLAIQRSLKNANLSINEIDFLCVVTSTGYLLPSLSARLIKQMNFRQNTQRIDIVGMGCNAGLNGLQAVNNWTIVNPDKNAVLLCVEVCSAFYVNDGSMRSHVVNSLFGDGAAAVVLRNDTALNDHMLPSIHGFSSYIIPDAIDSMRVDWDDSAQKFSFYLHHANPYLVGKNIAKPVHDLLEQHKLRIGNIDHWVVHGGGRNVISAVKINLGITSHDMRHTMSVLMDYGNVSSGSFLFSYERLLGEQVIKEGDLGVMITIGPGAQLETALLAW